MARLSCSFSLQHRAVPSNRVPILFFFGGGHNSVPQFLLHNNMRTNPKFQPPLCKDRRQFFWLLPEAGHRTQDCRGCTVNAMRPEEQPWPSANSGTRATHGSWSDSGITYSALGQWSGCEAVWRPLPLSFLKCRAFSCASWWTLEVDPLSQRQTSCTASALWGIDLG